MLSAGHQLERNFTWLNKQFSGHLLCKTLWAVILVFFFCVCVHAWDLAVGLRPGGSICVQLCTASLAILGAV